MYESPITMYMSDIQREIEKQTEEEMMVAINQSIGFDVDKNELIKALQYDREQYDKGFSDCKSYMLDKVKQAREEIDQAYEDFDGYDPQALCGYSSRVDEILDRLIAESEG